MTAQDELSQRYFDKCMEMFNLVQKYLPDDEYWEFFSLFNSLIKIEELLASKTDDEIERMRYHELHIYPKCPITQRIFDDKERILDKLCDMTNCEEFDSCWATKQFTPPTINLVHLKNGGYFHDSDSDVAT